MKTNLLIIFNIMLFSCNKATPVITDSPRGDYKIILISYEKKIPILKFIQSVKGLSLGEISESMKPLPATILNSLSKNQANQSLIEIEKLGAKAKIEKLQFKTPTIKDVEVKVQEEFVKHFSKIATNIDKSALAKCIELKTTFDTFPNMPLGPTEFNVTYSIVIQNVCSEYGGFRFMRNEDGAYLTKNCWKLSLGEAINIKVQKE